MYLWFYKVNTIKYYYYFIYDNDYIYEGGFVRKPSIKIYNTSLKIKLRELGILVINELKEYFNGKLQEFKLLNHIYIIQNSKNYNTINYKIYKYLSDNIKKGSVTTYSNIARIFNIHPRHVGIITRCNKMAIFIPCHRVIKSNGELGGYMGKNTFIKKFLLTIEGYIN